MDVGQLGLGLGLGAPKTPAAADFFSVGVRPFDIEIVGDKSTSILHRVVGFADGVLSTPRREVFEMWSGIDAFEVIRTELHADGWYWGRIAFF